MLMLHIHCTISKFFPQGLIQANNTTVQSLLTAPLMTGGQILGYGDGIQALNLPSGTETLGISGANAAKLIQVIPTGNLGVLGNNIIGLVAVPNIGIIAQTKDGDTFLTIL